MKVRFEDPLLERLEADAGFSKGMADALVKTFRLRVQVIRAAPDERVFHAMKSLRYGKHHGDLSGQQYMRLDEQWQLNLHIEDSDEGKRVVIVSTTDQTL
jgi:proteic killer suppression protein